VRWLLDWHEGLPYRVALPPGYDPRRRYPVVVYLHGSAERGGDTVRHLNNGVDLFVGQPLIAVAPQCPRSDTFGGSWYGGDSLTQRRVVHLIRALGQRRSVDANRVSLVGFSMGAIGTWALLERERELFCAAVPISGDLDPSTAHLYEGIPIWAFHGARDRLVSPEAIRAVAAQLRGRSPSFRYTEYPDEGHDAWRRALAEPELLPWLLSQRRAG
jgi:predicted peptidase